ncbi:MAG: SpoIVB peptidase S55 domain-containing protein [Synergistaceae bacterium]|nr:SpoIVB peptidase S55 domain-containing protein [Synergistaceae bacterium]
MNLFRLLICALVLLLAPAEQSEASRFTPSVPVLGVENLRPGMKGYALTVVSGREIVRFPVEIVSVIPGKGSPKHLIMIKASGSVIAATGGIAAGMSGSPVFINDKLIGAIGYGWNFSEHTLGLVTSFSDMASIWSWPEKIVSIPPAPALDDADKKKDQEDESQAGQEADNGKEDKEEDKLVVPVAAEQLSSPLFINGISTRKALETAALLGRDNFIPGGGFTDAVPVEMNATMLPGDAITVLLAWGDVTIGATGTLTAVAPDGRFIAFAHPFLGRGAVNYPVARAYIHKVIPSLESPFKVGSPLQIVGTVTQDRPQGIGGRIGYFTPSISATLDFTDAERNIKERKRFHVVPDPFIGAKLTAGVFTGLIDDLWGRKGQGTATLTLNVQGRGLISGWTRTNMFFSDSDLAAAALKETSELLDVVFLNPFAEVYPLGITVTTEFSPMPKLMYIEGVNLKGESFSSGETVEVEVLIRPYRKKQVKKSFTITIPKDASGICEILVRGGGIEPLNQSAIVQGWKTIENFRQLFTEMSALETNNELIIEFNYEKRSKDGKGRSDEDEPVSKEEQELLSELKQRRLKDGTLQIFKSEFVVEGLLRKLITVTPGNSSQSDEPETES